MAAGDSALAGAGAPAAEAPVSAPVAAPAVDTSSQVGESFGGFDGFTLDQPAPDTSGIEQPAEGQSSAEYLRDQMLKKIQAGKDGAADPADKPADKPVDAVIEPPKVDGDGTQTEEEKAAADKVAAEEAEKKTADEAAKNTEGHDEEEKLDLFAPDPLKPRDLAAKLEANPDVVAALEKAGINKNELFATARVAQKGAKVLSLFNNDVETAQVAKESAEQFGKLTDIIGSTESVDDTRKLLGEMMKFSYVLDEDGNPIVGENGVPMGDGTIGKTIDNIFQIGLSYWKSQAESSGNEDLKAAVEVLDEQYKQLASGSAKQRDYSNLDEETRKRLEQADTREKEVANREAAETKRKSTEFETSVTQNIETKLDDEIKAMLGSTSLSEGQLKYVLMQAKIKAAEQLESSTLFFSRLDTIMRQRMSEKTLNKRVAHGVNSIRPLLPSVVKGLLAEIGVQATSKADAVKTKVATQEEAGKSDIKGAGQPAKPTASMTPADLNKMAEDELVKANKPITMVNMMSQVLAVKKRLGLVASPRS